MACGTKVIKCTQYKWTLYTLPVLLNQSNNKTCEGKY